MKSGSDNFRDSAVKDIIENLSDEFDLIIYEPLISDSYFGSFKVPMILTILKMIRILLLLTEYQKD